VANTYVFNNTVARPTFALEWLSNNLDLNQTIIQPILVATMNDWQLNTTIAVPVLEAGIDAGEGLTLDKVMLQPSLAARIVSGQQITFDKTLSPPRLDAIITQEQSYSLLTTISNISLVASIVSNSNYILDATLAKPTVVGSILNEVINASTTSTFVINTMTSAHSTYSNFGFNSYFKLANSYYGINSTGVWKLTGDLDITTSIQTDVETPISSFDKQGMKACCDAIIFGRLQGDIEVVTVNDEQEEREGFIVNQDEREGLHRIRVRIPKGLKGATWQFKLRNVDGSQFSINNFEVFLRELQRIR